MRINWQDGLPDSCKPQAQADRYAAYLICQQRGHQSSGVVQPMIPVKDICKWCGTAYWIEEVLHESGAPQPPAVRGDYYPHSSHAFKQNSTSCMFCGGFLEVKRLMQEPCKARPPAPPMTETTNASDH